MKIFYWMAYYLSKGFFHLFYSHRVYGKKYIPKGPCIIAPNHASFLDPPLIAISCDEEVSFLARGTLFKNTFFKNFFLLLNTYPITGTAQDVGSLKLIIQLLQENKKVIIFPEGKRSKDGLILPIKPGIGMLASRCECPIIPVYIHGTHDIWPRNRFFPKLWRKKTACVFGHPILGDSFKDLPKKEAQEKIAVNIQKSLNMLKDWYLHGAKGDVP